MNAHFALAIAIVAEVIATSSLKASNGFTVLWPSIVVIIGYAVAFYFLSLTLKTMPIGVAYALWSGIGIALITAAGFILYQQKIDIAGIIGLMLIVSGVVVLNAFSKSAVH
ncbi:MAG: DMT family transporter [Alphaproteobacteria bacterium]